MIIRTIAIKCIAKSRTYYKNDSAGLNNNNSSSAVPFIQSCLRKNACCSQRQYFSSIAKQFQESVISNHVSNDDVYDCS